MSLLESVSIACPYCGEPNELVIDTSVTQQEYVEDCGVCCQPILLRIMIGEGNNIAVEARRENE